MTYERGFPKSCLVRNKQMHPKFAEFKYWGKLIAVTIGIFLLKGAAEVQAAIREIFVKPHQTDPSITLADKPHYVLYDPQAVGVLLFVFFPGTGGTPGRSPLLNTAIEQGYRAISLSYPNIISRERVMRGPRNKKLSNGLPCLLADVPI